MGIEASFYLFGKLYKINPTIINSWLLVIVLCIVACIIGAKAKKANFKDEPKRILHIAEIYVEAISKLLYSVMGERNSKFIPYIGTLAIYLVCANLLGLVGFTPPTSDYNVTLSLALITFFLIHFYAIKTQGIGSYIKGYFEPFFILFPINLLGELATPISLSFRLFGNILSGVIIMNLIYAGLTSILRALVPFVAPVFHIYFDIFSGVLQTFIFIMLSMVFISNHLASED